MNVKVFLVIFTILFITSCGKKEMADLMLKSLHEEIVAQKDKEIAEIKLQLEELKNQLNNEREMSALDSNKRRNENIRSLFAIE